MAWREKGYVQRVEPEAWCEFLTLAFLYSKVSSPLIKNEE